MAVVWTTGMAEKVQSRMDRSQPANVTRLTRDLISHIEKGNK